MSTRAQILAEIAAHLPDNTTGAITPAILRTELGTMVDYSDTTAEIAIAAHNSDPAAHLNIVRRTLAGDLTLTAADYQYQRIIPDADRNVVLPAESTAQWSFLLCHAGAAYNLTVKRAGGTVVGVMIPGSPLAVSWDGTAIGRC